MGLILPEKITGAKHGQGETPAFSTTQDNGGPEVIDHAPDGHGKSKGLWRT